jgi:hypothetical protein
MVYQDTSLTIRNSQMKLHNPGLINLVFLLALFSPNSQAQYNIPLATRALSFSGAAYCSYPSIDTWNCGMFCNYTSDLQNVS